METKFDLVNYLKYSVIKQSDESVKFLQSQEDRIRKIAYKGDFDRYIANLTLNAYLTGLEEGRKGLANQILKKL